MGQKKKLRTLIWKNEQLKESVSEYIKELRQKKNPTTEQVVEEYDNKEILPGEEEEKKC